jgi:hypothetical protein
MFNFLPETLDPTLRLLIYALMIVHILALSIWIILVVSGSKKKVETFE